MVLFQDICCGSQAVLAAGVSRDESFPANFTGEPDGVELSKKQCVIIGNGAAGINAAEALRSADRHAGITIISDEPVNAYSKVLLHYYIDSQIGKEGLFIRSDKFSLVG